jgi:hypothetical protein
LENDFVLWGRTNFHLRRTAREMAGGREKPLDRLPSQDRLAQWVADKEIQGSDRTAIAERKKAGPRETRFFRAVSKTLAHNAASALRRASLLERIRGIHARCCRGLACGTKDANEKKAAGDFPREITGRSRAFAKPSPCLAGFPGWKPITLNKQHENDR